MIADSNKLPEFQRLQYTFAAHLRDPEHNPAPEGLEDRRMAIYRELIYNNIEGLLEANFPVIHNLADAGLWQRLVRGFLSEYQSHTPLFFELGREFHRYLEARAERGAGDPPFLAELAHYEFAETAVGNDEHRIENIAHDPNGDLLSGQPVVSPLAWPLVYRFPVHQISPEFQPEAAPEIPTCLIVSRDRDDNVGFMESNPATLKLIEILKENPGYSGLDALNAVAALFPPEAKDAVIAAGAEMLGALRSRDVILGSRI